jgi:hypothetical protein
MIKKKYRMPWAVHNCCLKDTVLSYTQVSSPISYGFVLKSVKLTSGLRHFRKTLELIQRQSTHVTTSRFILIGLRGQNLPWCYMIALFHAAIYQSRRRSTYDPTKFQFWSFSPSRICYHGTSLKEKRKTADEVISRLDKPCILVAWSKTPASALPRICVPSSYKRI